MRMYAPWRNTRKFALLCTAVAAMAQNAAEHPSGNRTTPPTISSVAPVGMSRGTTVELTVEGFNLAGASAIYFSEPGIKGRIVRVKELPDLAEVRLGANGTASTVDLGPLPPRNQVTIEVDIAPEAQVGQAAFRLQTPLGTSPSGQLLIEPYYGESPDREPNDTLDGAFETFLPSILAGTISRPGDVDHFKITVKAGEELVFENPASMAGSTLQPVVSIVAPDQTVLKEFGGDGGASASYFAYRFAKAGTYYVRIGDFQQSGRGSHFYRIKAGNFPFVTSAYPLGLASGASRTVSLAGFNLGAGQVKVEGKASPEDPAAVVVRPEVDGGASFNQVKLGLGQEPEVEAAASNTSLANAQTIAVPSTVNGKVRGSHYFKFRAAKGQRVMLEVNARRLGSMLDSMIEVLDSRGNAIERATVRAVLETTTVLRDHDSASRGIRLQAWNGWAVGDYVMVGSELLRIEALPRGPDDDMIFDAFGGQRIAYLGTTSEMHAIDKAAYKVQIHPAGRQFSSNGLPLVRVNYQNDDGGPGYGKDSLVDFTAPADGEYLVRLRDVRGLSGEDYAYRLTVRPPRPDFRLSVAERNPNVPLGGAIPLTVTAFRMDGFDGPIAVELRDLPPGVTATQGVIGAGQVSATLLLRAAADVKAGAASELKIAGRAEAGGTAIERMANPEDRLKLISLMPPADITMRAETRVVEVEIGGTADLAVEIARHNGFGGRVPVEVRNLPPRVRVLDVGLNGVLLNENETRRGFTIEALPMAEPIEQLIYVSGRVETRSGLPASYAAPEPVLLRVKKPATRVSSR